MRFLTANQKQQHVNVRKELRQIASDDANVLFRLSLVTRAGFMVTTLRQSNNPPNGKVKSKVKSMLIISFDVKGIVRINNNSRRSWGFISSSRLSSQ
jgi:hypothetical protein